MLVVKIHLLSILMLLVALQYVASKKSDPCSVDAAFTYGKNDKIYFFKGDKYAYYNDDDAKNRGLSELYRKYSHLFLSKIIVRVLAFH